MRSSRLKTLGATPRAAPELRLNTYDAAIQAELSRRQAACRHEDGGNLDWWCNHYEFMHKKGVRWVQLGAPPSTVKSAWFQLCPQREKDIIAFALKHKPDLTSVDCSQRIDRCTMMEKGILPTITPKAKYFLGFFPGMGGRPLNRFILGWRVSHFRGSLSSSWQELQPARATDSTRTWQAMPSRPPP